MFSEQDQHFLARALQLAAYAEQQNEVPIGAVLVHGNTIIAEGWNQSICQHDPTAHAEIVALRKGSQRLQNYRLLDTTLYVTLEPCVMCAGALIHARIKRVVFGADDPKAGAVNSALNILDNPQLNHRVLWQSGLMQQQCSEILQNFFKRRR